MPWYHHECCIPPKLMAIYSVPHVGVSANRVLYAKILWFIIIIFPCFWPLSFWGIPYVGTTPYHISLSLHIIFLTDYIHFFSRDIPWYPHDCWFLYLPQPMVIYNDLEPMYTYIYIYTTLISPIRNLRESDLHCIPIYSIPIYTSIAGGCTVIPIISPFCP